MRINNEFSGTLTLTENSSRELLRVLKEQDEAFINDVFNGKCGFTLKSADGRCVEFVPKADRKTEPQTKLCRECDDYAGDGMYCVSNYLVYDFSISAENCETKRSK